MNIRDLRHEREVRALSLRQASEATGIPMNILASLEAEPEAVLKPGSTIARWRGEYERYLERQPARQPTLPAAGAPGAAHEPTETTALLSGAAFRSPQGIGRAIALGALVAVVVAAGLKVASLLLDRGQPAAVEEIADARPMVHRLSVRAIEPTRLRVEVDGNVVQDGVLPARTSLTFEARERLVVEIPDLTRVRMRYNERALTPLGNLSAGRRLVFIDDEGR